MRTINPDSGITANNYDWGRSDAISPSLGARVRTNSPDGIIIGSSGRLIVFEHYGMLTCYDLHFEKSEK